MTTPPRAPDWYPDPSGKPGLMYWDGRQWHADVPAAATSIPLSESAPPVKRATASMTKVWAGVTLVAVVIAALAVVTVVTLAGRNHPAPSSAPATSSAKSTTHPSHSTTVPPPPAAIGGVPGLAPFVREWSGMRESVVIDRTGHGHFHYMMPCASCSMADMPYNTIDFALTSVSNDTATGSITASSDPQLPVGEPVAATLAPQDTIQWAIGGKNVGLFCGSNPGYCGS
jgi:Protein of unknown function (DUF2510)